MCGCAAKDAASYFFFLLAADPPAGALLFVVDRNSVVATNRVYLRYRNSGRAELSTDPDRRPDDGNGIVHSGKVGNKYLMQPGNSGG